MVPIDLTGQVAVVTGGGQGLGQASATWLHRAGAEVVITFLDEQSGENRRRAEATVAGLSERASAVAADVRSPEELSRMFSQVVERHGGVRIVVNNAAIIRDRTLRNMTDDEWQSVIDTNLSGVFHVCRAAAAHLGEGGRIINMASISGQVGFFGQANYAAAKAGVIALTKVLAKELARQGVNVNAVAPGVALTEMGKTIPESVRERMLAEIPLRRFATVDEIAQVVLFLASELSSYVTGQTLHVNGGWWA